MSTTTEVPRADGFKWNVTARVDKFTAEHEAAVLAQLDAEGAPRSELSKRLTEQFSPYDSIEVDGNLLTRIGRLRLIDRLVGTASNQAITATTGRIGVGNSNTAAADTQTDLQAAAGAGNRQFELLDSAPTVGTGASAGVVTLVATFETGDANFAWEEWGIDGGTADGTTVTTDGNTTPGLINRKVTALGTKTSAAAWVFTVTITIT